MEYRAKLIGVATVLLCVAFASQALTLGRIRGAALVGQPLNMVVPVQVSSGEDASLACFEADVFHADARQDPSRVRLAVEPSGQPDTLNVRILSSVAVDEPVVTVFLRTLCDQKTTRRYVLLADFPSDVGPAVVPIRAPSVPLSVAPMADPALAQATAPAPASVATLPAPPALAAPAPAPSPAARTVVPAKPKPKVVQKTVKTVPVPKPAAAAPKSAPVAALPAAPAMPSGQPRLTLDAPLLLSEQADVLALTPQPGPSAEVQANLLKIQTLESDVKALLALAAKNEASLLDLRTRLQTAESERLPNWMVYALGALVLACLAVIVLLLRRPRPGVPVDNSHWSASVAAVPPAPDPVPSAYAGLEPKRITMPGTLDTLQPATPARPPAASVYEFAKEHDDGPVTQVDVSLLEMSESNFDNLMQTGVAHSAIRKPQSQKPLAAPMGTTRESHNLNSSAAFDVRQQAEFFVSLGQTDQAVRILEKHIADSDDPNPHVYLDLLAIFHSLSLKVDFRQFREDFNLLFNGRVQEFAAFKNEGQGLDAYVPALDAISAVWPTAKALSLIESFIFRDPMEAGSQPFDLAAFRDLLLLHAVAQRIVMVTAGLVTPVALAGVSAATQARPYFADSGLSMPLPLSSSLPIPMPSPYAYDPLPTELGAASGAAEVDLDLSFYTSSADVDLNLDLDLSDTPVAARPASAAGSELDVDIGMDLDLSQPLSEPLNLSLSEAPTPARGNLIDFDISIPELPPIADDKKSG